MSSAAAVRPAVVVLVADGARPDTLAAAIDAGELPAMQRLRDEGGLHTVTSAFPSVTGPAYTPFLLGRYPGPVGLPGLRWYDRARAAAPYPHFTRSYMGPEMRFMDRDLDPGAPTVFELAGGGLTALSMIGRGLRRRAQIGRQPGFLARAALTHWRGDVRGWLAIDREIGRRVARRIREERPPVTLAAFTGIDKVSHESGHDGPLVVEAMKIVDDAAALVRADAERDGRWARTQLWIVSDHGHSPVDAHEDLAGTCAALGYRVIAHPWVHSVRTPDVAVMVSGNAMAHVYVELGRRERPWWGELGARWERLAQALLARPAVDLLLLPHSPARCEVRAAGRGRALVEHDGGRFAYRPLDGGDPLGLGGAGEWDERGAWGATQGTPYPDSVVQLAHLAGSARAGEIILSAAAGWDFRARYEPIPHRSSHGALTREHMLVPLLLSRPARRTPRRTVDVMPSALAALGLPVPGGVDGESFM